MHGFLTVMGLCEPYRKNRTGFEVFFNVARSAAKKWQKNRRATGIGFTYLIDWLKRPRRGKEHQRVVAKR